ncbi:MAG: protein phosphatase 2C domain-containing protein [Myxococcales bacterium]|nr:protein phosphatase 2C domain-containing protein [Myxococcales bacterium]
MRYFSAALSDVGQKRTNNEDFHLEDADLGLYLVSDGVGGHQAGEVASKTTATTIRDLVAEHHDSLVRWNAESNGHVKILRFLEQAVERACEVVHQTAQDDPDLKGMAATLTLLLAFEQRAIVAHVGDSRLYLARGDRVHLLTNDHTLGNELVREGVISKEDAKNHRAANVLVRAIGQHPTVKVDTLVLDVLSGDTFILCSDGFSNYLERAAELRGLISEESLEKTAQDLVALANERGGSDNITVVAVRAEVDEASRPIELKRTGEIALWQSVLADCPLFAELTYQEIQRVLSFSDVQRIEANAPVLVPGEDSDAMRILLIGELSLSRGRDHEKILAPGAVLGVTSLFKPRPCKISVVAQTPVQLLVLRGEQVGRLLKQKPHLGVKLLKNLLNRVGDRMDQFKMADLDI